jgi:hypothetical protein
LLALPVSEAIARIRAQHGVPHAGTAKEDATATADAPAAAAEAARRNLAIMTATTTRANAEGAARRAERSAPIPMLQPAAQPVPTSPAEALPAAKASASAPAEEATAADAGAAAPAEAPPTAEAVAAASTVDPAANPARSAPIEAPPVAGAHAAAMSTDAPASTAPRTGEINADAHLLAIELALSAGERFLVHATVAQMSPGAREVLLDQLLSASVPQGAAILRAAIQDLTIAQTQPIEIGTAPVPGDGARISQLSEDDRTLDMQPAGSHEADDDQADTADADAGADTDTDTDTDTDQADADGDQPDADTETETETDTDQADADGDQPDAETETETETDTETDADADQADADTEQGDDHNHPEADPAAAHGSTRVAQATVPAAGLPTLSPEALRHFKAIESALTFAERMRVFELGARLSAAELRGWIAELTALPMSEAVTRVRAALAAVDGAAHTAKKGGVS